MKKTSKLLSVILATFLLLQTFSMICFAETTSNLPTDLTWSSTKNGYFEMFIPEHLTEYFTLRINLYKDDVLFDTIQTSLHPSTLENDRIFSRSYLTDEILEGGSGIYTYTVTVGNETTQLSTPFEFEEPTHVLDVPANVTLVDGQVRWTPLADAYCGGYYVHYFVGYPDGTIDFVYGQEEGGATSDYQDYSGDNDVPYYFNQQVDIYYNQDPQKYPKESAFLMAAVQALSSDVFLAKDSEFSTPVAMSEDTETEFKFNLPNVNAEKGATITYSDVDDYVPKRMQFGLVYASNLYEENIETPATITYTGNGVNYTQTLDETPLTTEYGAAWYELEFTLPADLASGTYQAVIRLAIATAKDANDVKPYVITIPELTINPTYTADFVINDGADMATDKNLTLSFTVDGYTKYKVGDGTYTNLPANNIATYTVAPESGMKEIVITFANEEESKTETVTKSILLSNRRTITYYADGAVFDTVVLDCGSPIQQLAANPTVEGKTFAGWDAEIPTVMPDSDLSFHAIFVAAPTQDLNELLTEEEVANGYTVTSSVSVAVANTNINHELTTEYAQYTVAMTLDITLQKVKEGNTPESISEPGALVAFEIEIPDSLKNKGDYIILRDHNGTVETISRTPNAYGEYLTVSGNTITLYANRFSLYTLATREVVAPPVGGGSGKLSYSVNFNSNGGSKVKAVNVVSGKTISKPEDPTKEGYTFDGWYQDAELTQLFDFATGIKKSISLYAKWIEAAPSMKLVLTIGQTQATINGETFVNDVAPIIVNDRTMLPIRFVAEKLGATVGWEEETRTVTVTLGEVAVSLVVGESVAKVNGEEQALDSPSFIQNDRTYLPVRFIMESLKLKVDWDESNHQVTIIK